MTKIKLLDIFSIENIVSRKKNTFSAPNISNKFKYNFNFIIKFEFFLDNKYINSFKINKKKK